ncbi:MFS transporter [Streptomyces sp. NPDC059373]
MTTSADTGRRSSGNAIVAVLSFAGIVVAVMQTLVVPLISQLPTLLHSSASDASWVVTATLLAGAVATPVMGRLGDMYGKRRILFVSLGLLVAGSALCAFTSTLLPMVIGRALQGGAMGVIPLGISIMRDELPRERMGSAMALMSSSLGIGGALGLPGAAAIAQHSDWHTLFLVSGGLGVVAIALVAFLVPESPVRTPGRFDIPGAIGLTAGLICLLLPITKGADWGWGSGTVLGLFGAAVVILVSWGVLELRTDAPLVDLRTTARRQVLLTNLASVLVGFVLYAQMLALPQILELPKVTGYGLGLSMVAAGLCLAPGGLVMIVISPISARISATKGPKVSLLIGTVIATGGYALGFGLIHSVWEVILVGTVIGSGIAFAYAAMPALIMGAVPPSETAAANGLNTLMRSIGTSTSSAVVGVVLAHMTITLGEGTSAAVVPSMDGFRTAFGIACLVGVVALAVGVFIPGRTAEGRTAFTVRPSAEAGTEAEASAEPLNESEPQMLTPKS